MHRHSRYQHVAFSLPYLLLSLQCAPIRRTRATCICRVVSLSNQSMHVSRLMDRLITPLSKCEFRLIRSLVSNRSIDRAIDFGLVSFFLCFDLIDPRDAQAHRNQTKRLPQIADGSGEKTAMERLPGALDHKARSAHHTPRIRSPRHESSPHRRRAPHIDRIALLTLRRAV
jgi:hypothetical protein